LFSSVDEYHFNRELILEVLEFSKETSEFYLKKSVFHLTNSIIKFEEINKNLFDNFLSKLVLENKFITEKYLSDKDVSGMLKLSEDKENTYKFEFLVILSHNFRTIINSVLSYGMYSSIPQKSSFIQKIDQMILEEISLIKKQFESKFLVSKDSNTGVIFNQFQRSLIELLVQNLAHLYKTFRLEKLWGKHEKDLRV